MNILIIDDEPLVRRSLGRVLQSRGHAVSEAIDGKAGLEAWRAQKPDLVFLDVLMPEMTGPEVLERMGDDRAKVILMSAFSGSGDELQTRLAGRIAHFLVKPFENIFEIADLAERVYK